MDHGILSKDWPIGVSVDRFRLNASTTSVKARSIGRGA
jgi:hypothetical protein